MDTPRSRVASRGIISNALVPPLQRPATSPYFAKPFLPDPVVGGRVWALQLNDPGANIANRSKLLGRPGTGLLQGTRKRREASSPRWSKPTLGDVTEFFDPTISHFSVRRSEGPPASPLSRTVMQRQSMASVVKSAATELSGSTTTPQQKRKICRPRLWDGGLSAKSQTFDELHRAEIDRHHYKFILGPSYRGQRKYRIAPKLLEAAPMNMPGGLEARALSEIVAVIKAEEGVFDEYWMNPSSRALWYLPRALSKLHRWEEFVHYLCNPDYVIEAILEYGVLEVLHNFENALGHIIAQRSNTTAFSTLKQQTIDTCCQNAISSYLDFVRKHREALASSPRNVFALALATKGRVQEDAWSQITDLQALLNRCVQKLPHQEIDTMVRIYRALERAREHGLDTCLPLDARDQFESVADEMSQAMQRMWQSTKDENVLESCADQLLGLSGNHAQQRSRTQMVNQGFKDLALVVSGAPQSPLCSPSEAYIVLSVRRPQRLPDVEIVQVVAACAGVPDDQLQVVMRRGTSVVLRILQKSERQGDNKISGAIDVRDRILQMASDPNSPLRQSGIVQGRGIRSGRWEHVRIALSNTCDMEYEREYLVTFVLPALRVECRKRKILLTWSDLGSSMSLSDEETEREALNRMKALQLCGIQPPGCNMRPFLLSLLGSRCGKTFQDIMKSQVNDYPHPVQSAALSKLEWIWRKDHLMYSIPYLQVCDAYLRCIDASESMFILRNHEWLSDPNVANRMPAIIHDKFCEQSDEMNQVVTQFKQVIQRNAERQNRIITYNPKFLSLLGPKFVQDNAEMPEDVFRTDYRRLRSVVIVNKNFWQEMKLRGNEILQSCNGVHKSKGMVSKKELRHILEQHKVLSLLSDAEMVRLIAAYEVDANGSIDYAALINQFVTEGRVRMSGMATLGLKVYQRLLNTIDAYFPISVPPGTRHDWDLNEQEALLDIYASATCNGVNDHIFGQLKDFASSHETLDAVAVRGSSGSGKSTLMASFARFCIVELGHSINIIFYCYQPWHGEQDIIRCLVGQLDRSILDHAQERGQTLSVRALETGLARHAQTRSKDVLIIADGLLLSEIEDQIVCTVKNHNLLYANRARVVFTAVPAEHHSADDVLSLSILPLMPSEKLKLVHFQESRDGMSLYPQVVADLCKKPNGANNAKFLVVAVKFLSHFRDQEHMQILHEMPDNVKELYGLMIFPLLERIFSMQTIQHIFVLLFFEGEGGLLRSELAKLAQHGKMKEHDINELCENLRSLGIAAVTAESDRFIITCDEVKTAIHDRYVSSHSRLKDKLHEVLALEKTIRMFSHSKREETGQSHQSAEVNAQNATDVHFKRRTSDTNIRSDTTAHGDMHDTLRTVDLQNNNLFALPVEIFSKISNPEEVCELYAGSNCIKSIDQRINLLINLHRLDLSVNAITHLPEQIGLLTNLELLDVSDNQVKEVVPSLWSLQQLHTLRFCRNHVAQLDNGLGNLTSLRELCFSRNRLLSIPEMIVELTRLEILDLSGNNLAEIPDLFTFTCLRMLCLASNRLSTIPSLSMALLLEDLDLESNFLTSVPTMVSCYPNLKRINFADNKIQYLEGHISGSLALESYNICENKIEHIPADYGLLTNLKTLAIANNKLKAVPVELFNLHGLTNLDVSANQIEVIPEQIANLTCLQNLYLSDNRIAEFPIQLCDMKHITQLHLEKNPVDLDDPVLKMKREERDKKTAQKHSDIQRASSGWEEHEAQVLMMRTISSKQDEERMIQRKLRLGDRTKIE